MTENRTTSIDIDWDKVVAGDRKEFDRLVEAELDNLLELAMHELSYRVAVGDLPPSYMTAAELVGEAMIRAWDNRDKKPKGMEPRAWLFAMLLRTADAIAERRRKIEELEALSTDAPIPDVPLVVDPVYDDDEEFYEWYQPDEALKWEDVLPATSFTPEDFVELMEETKEEAQTRKERGEATEKLLLKRRASLLCYRYGFSLKQVCRILEKTPGEVAPLLEEAHARLKESAGG